MDGGGGRHNTVAPVPCLQHDMAPDVVPWRQSIFAHSVKCIAQMHYLLETKIEVHNVNYFLFACSF
jgi:hypothetical protein